MKYKSISILIPVYNEKRYIETCLNSLLAQDYPDFEIIAVDDGSTDETLDILYRLSKKNKHVRVLKQHHRGPGAARNLAAKKARGDILVFCDADMRFARDYLTHITYDIRRGKAIGTTYGFEEVSNYGKNSWTRCFGKIRWNAVEKGIKEYPAFSAILKSEFNKVGGFDFSRGYSDDLSLSERLGIMGKVVKAKCYHASPETLKELYSQFKWMGKGILPSLAKKDRILSMKLKKIMFLLLPFMLFLLGLLYFVGIHLTLIFVLFFVLLSLFSLGVKAARREKHSPLVFVYPVFFMAKYVAFTHGFFSYLLTGQNKK